MDMQRSVSEEKLRTNYRTYLRTWVYLEDQPLNQWVQKMYKKRIYSQKATIDSMAQVLNDELAKYDGQDFDEHYNIRHISELLG